MSNKSGGNIIKIGRQIIDEIKSRKKKEALKRGIAPDKVPIWPLLTPEERARCKVLLKTIQDIGEEKESAN